MGENLSSVKLKAYYNDLSKNEKSQFLKYLLVQFDYSYSAAQSKMTGKSEMNKRDLILIGEVVKNELWKV